MVWCRPAVPIFADDGEHDVFGGHARASAVDRTSMAFGLLASSVCVAIIVLDLAGADAVRQRAEGAVGGGGCRRRPPSCQRG